MAYEKVIRNRYHEPGSPEDPEHTSANHSDDFQDFHVPMERMHNSNLHDWGIASGLEVSGTIDGTNIIVSPGVAIDSTGQLISLSSKGNISSSLDSINEVNVPVNLSTVNHAGKTVYVTIQFSESLRAGGVTGKLEQVPRIRLQPVDALSDLEKNSLIDGKTLVLAIAVVNSQGNLAELKVADSEHSRRLIGQTIDELRIQRPDKTGDKVENKLSGKIGPGGEGGLKVTLPDTQGSILFARENGSDSAKLEINANVGVGTRNPKEKFDVSGTIRLFGKNAFQGHDSFLRINQDNQFEDGTHFAHRANFAGGITTGTWWNVEPGAGNLLVEGKVGIGIKAPSEKLEVNGNIKLHPNTSFFRPATTDNNGTSIRSIGTRHPFPGPIIFDPIEFPRRSWIIVGEGDQAKALEFYIYRSSRSITAGNGWTVNANIKNFLIDHPLYPDTHELTHSTLEGPEIAVFYRGEAQLSNGQFTILLPDYFEALTRKENRTVLLTPEFEEGTEVSMLAASKVKDGRFTVKMTDSKNPSQRFYWEVKAIRADVDLLQVEREKVPGNLSEST